MKPKEVYRNATAYCLVQLFLPGCVLLAHGTGREFVLANHWVFLILYAAGTIFFLRKLWKSQHTWVGLPELIVSFVNAGVLLATMGLPGCIGAVVGLVCGWMALLRAPKGIWKILCCVLAGGMTLLFLPVIGMLFLFSGIRNTEVTQSVDSPEGTYTAIVSVEDSGALGGNTVVSLRDNRRTIPILIGSFVDQRKLYQGQWYESDGMELCWEDNTVLSVDGVACAVTSEDCGTILQTARTLGISLRNGKVLESSDSHGGFLGDGLTVVKIQGDISSMTGEGWHSLPLTSGAEKIPSYLSLSDPLPVRGKWYFYDRHTQRTDAYDPSPLLTRHSCNFTFALWDEDTKILTYYKIDT